MKKVTYLLPFFLVIIMLASPVSAAKFQANSIPIQASLGSTIGKCAVAAGAGALAGAVAGSFLPGVGNVVGGIAGGIIGFGACVWHEYKNEGSSDKNRTTLVFTHSFSINDTPETSIYSSYTPVDSNEVDQQAQSDINTLMSKLSPGFVTYELVHAGDNQFESAVFVAPNKLYGPMVFPATFFFQANGNTDVKQTNIVTSVVFEVVDADGTTVDKIVITGSFSATPGQVLTFTEILKAPDAYSSAVDALLNGQVDTSFLEELTKSPAIKPYFVKVELYGIAQNYYWDDSNSSWVLDTEVPFSITFSADKMDGNEQPGFYVFSGFDTMFPAALQTDPRAYSFYAYQVSEYGAMGNAVVRVWGQGIALYNQNWAYRAYVEANTPLYAPVSGITVVDEARVIVLREYPSSVEVAAIQPLSSPVSLGDLLAYAKKVEGNVYLSKPTTATDVVNYEVFVVVKGHVIYNSTTKDFWLIAKPDVIVQDGVLVINSQVFSQISPLVDDGTINESERSVINSDIDVMIQGLSSKIAAASALEEQASRYSNSSAVFYAQQAINYYSSAINVLSQAKAGDAQVVQNNLVQARLYEEAGDQAVKAAQLALSGNYDQAAQVFDGAQNLVKQAESALPVAGGSVTGIVEWLKAHWKLLLLILAGILLVYIVLKIFL